MTVVVAAADEAAALQYIAPYRIAPSVRSLETGRDALIVYDDLSKHA
jgi:F-type H+-transporting ATPase subunit alpha